MNRPHNRPTAQTNGPQPAKGAKPLQIAYIMTRNEFSFYELNQDQQTYLAGAYLQEINDQNGEGTSYAEYTDPFAFVDFETVAEYYAGTTFVPDDFPCSSWLPDDDPDYDQDNDPTEPTEQNDQTTRVCFRAFPDGEIIALFPDEITDCIQYLCGSYMHNGQHSDASLDLLRELRHSDPEEYAPLYDELTALGYRLEVDDRYQIGDTEPDQTFCVYAGYYELYVTTEPMPAPFVLVGEYTTIDDALDYCDECGDNVVYCDNVRDFLPIYLYEYNQDNGYEYYHIQTNNDQEHDPNDSTTSAAVKHEATAAVLRSVGYEFTTARKVHDTLWNARKSPFCETDNYDLCVYSVSHAVWNNDRVCMPLFLQVLEDRQHDQRLANYLLTDIVAAAYECDLGFDFDDECDCEDFINDICRTLHEWQAPAFAA